MYFSAPNSQNYTGLVLCKYLGDITLQNYVNGSPVSWEVFTEDAAISWLRSQNAPAVDDQNYDPFFSFYADSFAADFSPASGIGASIALGLQQLAGECFPFVLGIIGALLVLRLLPLIVRKIFKRCGVDLVDRAKVRAEVSRRALLRK